VYPDFSRCLVPGPAPAGKQLGGIDFGFRNPFAAVWGVHDRAGVLWLTGEHYARGKPLGYHAGHLPRDVTWYADPAGAQERCELRLANFVVRQGVNELRVGIMAVATRIEQGTLRVLEGRCPNLVYEAGLYRYSDDPGDAGRETPVDEHNHALAALRYLIAALDKGRLARGPRFPASPALSAEEAAAQARAAEEAQRERERRLQREYLLGDGPHWTRIL